MLASYETDIVAWSHEQAQWLKAGPFDQLDLEHWWEKLETWVRANSGSFPAGWPCCWLIFSSGNTPNWVAGARRGKS